MKMEFKCRTIKVNTHTTELIAHHHVTHIL